MMSAGMAVAACCVASAALVGGAGGAGDEPAEAKAKPHATVTLISDADAFAPGSTTTLGLSFAIEKNWHLYWNGRNDSGMAPIAEFTLPAGFAAGAWEWPAPKRYLQPGDILDHIYENRVTLLVPVTVPADAKTGTNATITAKVEWLVCNEACIPESADVSITLPIGQPSSRARRWPDAKYVTEARAALPIELPADGKVATITWPKADEAQIRVPGAVGVAFFPANECSELTHASADTLTKGELLTLRIKKGETAGLRGVLEVRMPGEKHPKTYIIDSKPASAGKDNAKGAETTHAPTNQGTDAPPTERR